MAPRQQLHDNLGVIVGDTDKVYFQPPPEHKMQYPCIRYELSDIQPLFADNVPFLITRSYSITVIDENPDSEIPGKVAALPMSRFDRHFKAGNLNHYVFTVYF